MSAPRRTPKSQRATWALVLAAFVSAWPGVARTQEAYDEDSVKAAFIYHFSTFVVWPESTGEGGDFIIAVLGDDEIKDELERYLPGHSIQGRAMRVRSLRSIGELGDDHVLFIGASRKRALAHDLASVGDRPILIVTEAEGALEQGSMINFRIVDERVRFEISLPAAERSGLVLSSRLLAAAMHVDTTSGIIEFAPDSRPSSELPGQNPRGRPGAGRIAGRQGRRR